MNGHSDLTHNIGRLLNYFGNIAVRRLNSISDYVGTDDERVGKIQTMVNLLLINIPDEAEIFEHVHYEGGLQKSPYVKPHEYLETEFDITF